MRALIRHLKSGLFYVGDGRWAAKVEKAWNFVTAFRALAFARDNHLRGVEVVKAFGEPEYDVPTILAAEDQECAAMLLKAAFKATGLPNRLVIVEDGQRAVDYLKGKQPYDDRTQNPLPGVLLLDLKMPRMDGFAVLAWLRQAREFSALPVVVLSCSPRETDIKRAKELGAQEYLVKPLGYHELTGMLKDVAQRWLPSSRVLSPEAAFVNLG
jgi:CheY-like chemotaxis protein